jgi:hypothetical protein
MGGTGSVFMSAEKNMIAAGQASWISVTGKICAGNTYITTRIQYADFPHSTWEVFFKNISRIFSVSMKF